MSSPADPTPIDLNTVVLRIDERGRLLAIQGDVETPIVARRAFPWSDPKSFVSLRNKDGHELAIIESLDALPPALAEPIARFLAGATFIPRITRIVEVNLEHGYQLWTVDTDAGPAELRVQEREDIRFLGKNRFTLKDANGNVYEIPDLTTLDEASQDQVLRVL